MAAHDPDGRRSTGGDDRASPKGSASFVPLRGSGKQRYEKPRITFVEPLEAVAAVCGGPTGKAAFPMCAVGSS